MLSPEPEFYVIFSARYSVDDEVFKVEAIFTSESDAVAHAELLRNSGNYQHISVPHKEMMSSILDRLLHQKLRCLAAMGTQELVVKFEK